MDRVAPLYEAPVSSFQCIGQINIEEDNHWPLTFANRKSARLYTKLNLFDFWLVRVYEYTDCTLHELVHLMVNWYIMDIPIMESITV